MEICVLLDGEIDRTVSISLSTEDETATSKLYISKGELGGRYHCKCVF